MKNVFVRIVFRSGGTGYSIDTMIIPNTMQIIATMFMSRIIELNIGVNLPNIDNG